MTKKNHNPFVGATPYDIGDSKYFFGRNDDIRSVFIDVKARRFSVLSGKSASGKTSFVRAGLIPAIEALRYSQIKEQSKVITPPVILIRDWSKLRAGADSKVTIDDFKSHLLKWIGIEVNRLDKDKVTNKTEGAIGKLYNASIVKDPIEGLVHLSRSFDGLYIIFDQFEELFVGEELPAHEICRFLEELYHQDTGIKIIVSLRQEYVIELRPLEGTIGSIMQRTHFLSEFQTGEEAKTPVEEAISSILREENIGIDKATLKRITKNCRMYVKRGEKKHWKIEVNMLKLQAFFQSLLFVLEEDPIDNQNHKDLIGAFKEKKIIDQYLLDTYIEYIIENDHYCSTEENVFDTALTRWLNLNLSDNNDNKLNSIKQYISAHELTGKLGGIKWLLAILSKHLSSEGKKLPLTIRYHKKRLIGDATGDKEKVKITDLFDYAIKYLCMLNILKISDNAVAELVHDQIGDSLLRWAEEYENTWEYCKNSPISNNGVSLKPIKKTLVQDDIKDTFPRKKLIGCIIRGDVKDIIQNELPTFSGVEFKNWEFRGSLFRDCVFEKCLFDSCILSGVMFINCTFSKTKIEGLKYETSQIDIAGGVINSLTFEGCELEQLNLCANPGPKGKNIILTQDDALTFSKTKIRLSKFEEIKGNSDSVIIKEDSEFEYCIWDMDSSKYFKANPYQFISCGIVKPNSASRPV